VYVSVLRNIVMKMYSLLSVLLFINIIVASVVFFKVVYTFNILGKTAHSIQGSYILKGRNFRERTNYIYQYTDVNKNSKYT